MSSSRLLARSVSSIARSDVCAFCHTRQQLLIGRNNILQQPTRAVQPNVFRRTYAQKLDVKRLRTDVDKRARVGWYTLLRQSGPVLPAADKAEAIYNDFVAHKDKKDYWKLIKQFTTKYKVSMEDITGLALITYMIPDLSDPTKRAMLPPSQHKTIAGLLFQGCAENEEPLAIKHIMTAVYLNNHTTHPGARDIALMFPKSEILKYQKILEKIANKNDPEALTLLGLFAEKEAQPAKARAFYEKALQISWVYDYVLGSRHPAQLPIMSPWNALGYLLKSDSKKPASLTQAKEIFEKGANKGDDPLSYYELSNFLARDDPEWLRCITKAAASGHRDAMFRLAEYYNDLGSSNSPISTSKQPAKLKTTLNWLLGWSHESWGQPGTDRLAEQWFEAAANAGHKPALLKWADLLEGKGEGEKARNVLRQIVEPVKGREVEVWPQIVHQAKGRLSGIRVV